MPPSIRVETSATYKIQVQCSDKEILSEIFNTYTNKKGSEYDDKQNLLRLWRGSLECAIQEMLVEKQIPDYFFIEYSEISEEDIKYDFIFKTEIPKEDATLLLTDKIGDVYRQAMKTLFAGFDPEFYCINPSKNQQAVTTNV